MSNSHKWSNVAVALGALTASAVALTGITVASPGVFSTSGSVPSDGAYIFLEVEGMTQVNEGVFRVTGGGAGTFKVEDVDGNELSTASYDAFTSGTFRVITFNVSVTTATTINPSGGDFERIDTTTIHDTQRKSIPGLPSAMAYDMDHKWDPTDTGLKALNAAYKANQRQAVMFTFGTGGPKMVFAGFVGAHLAPGGQSQGLVTTRTTFTVDGFPNYLAS